MWCDIQITLTSFYNIVYNYTKTFFKKKFLILLKISVLTLTGIIEPASNKNSILFSNILIAGTVSILGHISRIRLITSSFLLILALSFLGFLYSVSTRLQTYYIKATSFPKSFNCPLNWSPIVFLISFLSSSIWCPCFKVEPILTSTIFESIVYNPYEILKNLG